MGYKENLESHIRESNNLIQQYQTIVRETNRPEERSRARRIIDKQWDLIASYLDEYLPLCDHLQTNVAADIMEIIAHFPDYVERLQSSAMSQAAGDLQGLLRDEGLSGPEQATQTIAATIPTERPHLFRTGLCRGYPLEPSPQQYFVAQEFSPDRDDLLRALEAAFSEFNLRPYRADQDIQPGHILCKIAAKIQTTLFSIFELTQTQNRNVYLELGIAMGLGRPFVLVKESDAEVSPLAQGLEYYNIHSYLDLQRELGDRLRQYLLNIARYRAPDLSPTGSSDTYIISHGDHDMPPDFCFALVEALAPRGLTPVLIGTDNREVAIALDSAGIPHRIVSGTGRTQLDAASQAIQAARFGIYRVDPECSPDAFLILGIALGLDRPWAIISREGATLPSDIRGLSGAEFRSFTGLGDRFLRRFGDLIDQ